MRILAESDSEERVRCCIPTALQVEHSRAVPPLHQEQLECVPNTARDLLSEMDAEHEGSGMVCLLEERV